MSEVYWLKNCQILEHLDVIDFNAYLKQSYWLLDKIP